MFVQNHNKNWMSQGREQDSRGMDHWSCLQRINVVGGEVAVAGLWDVFEGMQNCCLYVWWVESSPTQVSWTSGNKFAGHMNGCFSSGQKVGRWYGIARGPAGWKWWRENGPTGAGGRRKLPWDDCWHWTCRQRGGRQWWGCIAGQSRFASTASLGRCRFGHVVVARIEKFLLFKADKFCLKFETKK